MKKLTFLLLLIPVLAFGEATHFTDLTVDDDLVVTDDAAVGGDLTITGTTAFTGGVTFSGVLSIPDGTALLPSLTNTGDTNTGLWFSAADTFNITNGGVEQFEIDATSLDIVPDTNITGALDVDGDTDVDDFTASGVVDVADGAEATPSLVNTGDVDTGVWFSAADTVNLSCGATEQVELDATSLDIVPDTNITGALDVDGDTDVDDFTVSGVSDFAAGAEATPSIIPTGDVDTGVWFSAADTINISTGATERLELDATSLDIVPDTNITGAIDVDGDTDLDDVTISGVTDMAVGAVGAPALFFTGSATTGLYQTAADQVGVTVSGANVGTWDSTGLAADGFNGPIGTTTPAAGTFTDVAGSGDFSYGSDPGDLHLYMRRTSTVKYIDTFDYGSDAHLAVMWDLTGVIGAGTNATAATPGWNTLITGGAGGPDSESTVTNTINQLRAYTPRIEIVVELATVAVGQDFSFGFYAAANEYVELVSEPATGANWLFRVDDTAGADTVDSAIAVSTDPTKLEIWTAADGTVGYAIDDVAGTLVGMTNNMTANGHYARWILTDVAAAPHTAAVDYYESEQLKQQ